MDFGIAKRVAMVAAASKGLGKATALALAQEGVRVSICARHPAELEVARKEISAAGEVVTHVADVSDADELHEWYDATRTQLGPVDILVTNTGGPPVKRFMDLTDAQWQAGVDSTLMNVVRLSRLVVPGMRERGWGRIVHLTSLVAKQPSDELTISSTLRAGLSALTRTMAHQLGPAGITVNALLPGHIKTDRQLEIAEIRTKERGISFEQYFADQAAQIPLKRLGEPREIGEVVAFLTSARASYINGVSLLVDGGLVRAV